MDYDLSIYSSAFKMDDNERINLLARCVLEWYFIETRNAEDVSGPLPEHPELRKELLDYQISNLQKWAEKDLNKLQENITDFYETLGEQLDPDSDLSLLTPSEIPRFLTNLVRDLKFKEKDYWTNNG